MAAASEAPAERFFAPPGLRVDGGTLAELGYEDPEGQDTVVKATGGKKASWGWTMIGKKTKGDSEPDGVDEGSPVWLFVAAKQDNVTDAPSSDFSGAGPTKLTLVVPSFKLAACAAPELVPHPGQRLSFSLEFVRTKGGSSSCTIGVVLTRLASELEHGNSESPTWRVISNSEFNHALLNDTHDSKLSRSVNGWYAREGRGTHDFTSIEPGNTIRVCLDYTQGTNGVLTVGPEGDEKTLSSEISPLAVPFVTAMGFDVTVSDVKLTSSGAMIKSARKG
jgi:hypothetical protein